MPTIPFPSIPPYPGVPQLPREVGVVQSAIILDIGALGEILANALQFPSNWGIYDSRGQRLGDPEGFSTKERILAGIGLTQGATVLSTLTFDFLKESKIANFPIERGSFSNYNKVEQPAAPVIAFSLDGDDADRANFLAAIDAAVKSTELYSVLTPEVAYVNYNLERYTYSRRASRGVNLLVVEIVLQEIRQVSASFAQGSTQINKPKDPGASNQIDAGKVQTNTPDQSTLKAIAKKLGVVD